MTVGLIIALGVAIVALIAVTVIHLGGLRQVVANYNELKPRHACLRRVLEGRRKQVIELRRENARLERELADALKLRDAEQIKRRDAERLAARVIVNEAAA